MLAGGAVGDSGVAGGADSVGIFVEEVLGGFFEGGGESVGGGQGGAVFGGDEGEDGGAGVGGGLVGAVFEFAEAGIGGGGGGLLAGCGVGEGLDHSGDDGDGLAGDAAEGFFVGGDGFEPGSFLAAAVEVDSGFDADEFFEAGDDGGRGGADGAWPRRFVDS